MSKKNYLMPWRAVMVLRIAKFLGVTVVLMGYEDHKNQGEASREIVVEEFAGRVALTEQVALLTIEIQRLTDALTSSAAKDSWQQSASRLI